MRAKRFVMAAFTAASIAYTSAIDAGADYGVNGSAVGESTFDDVHWGDLIGDSGDALRNDRDVDQDFESDDILALNLSHAGQRNARKLGFRMQRKALRNLDLWLYRLRPPRSMTSRAALALLRRTDPQGFYDGNATYTLAEGATPCAGTRCYGQAAIGWDAGACAVQARIGMIDTAVDVGSAALAGQRVESHRFSRGEATAPEVAHGTAVAALLIGTPGSGFPGLLPASELVAADVFSLDPQGHLATDAARLAAGLDWLIGQSPSVINLSFTGPDNSVVHAAARRVVNAGIPLVAAAGNLGPSAPPQYPAAFTEVIAVTAVDRNLQVYARANQGPYIEFAAPGVGIWTPAERGAGVFREGTSFATPFVAAAIARMKAIDGKLAPASIRSQLEKGARDLGPPGRDPVFGAGLVQAPACAH